jgi:hypothetical protein
MCAAFLLVAFTPSWQLAQFEVMPACVKFDGTHANVEWQLPHSWVVGMWFVPLPVAAEPLWQVEQVPETWEWSTRRTGLQALVAWQLSQLVPVAMCVVPLPVALTPSWQL